MTNVGFVVEKYLDGYVKVRYHCHMTGKYRRSVHRDCNTSLKLTHQIPAIFHNLKRDMTHIILCKELVSLILKKISYQIDLKKYTSFMLGKRIVFIDGR